MTRVIVCVAALMVLMTESLVAGDVRIERIDFAPGATSASVSSAITGHETVNYTFEATAGRSLSIVLQTDNLGNYFNIFEPGKLPGEDYAMFVGSTEGDRFEGILLNEGDYMVQVYIIRSAARRGEAARYTLELSTISDKR